MTPDRWPRRILTWDPAGGWIWKNNVEGFSSSGDRNGDGERDPHYFLHEMNLTGFAIPDQGRWALDPSFGSMADSLFDISERFCI